MKTEKRKIRILPLFLLALLLSSGFLFSLKIPTVKASSFVFSEDFENWNANGWTVVESGSGSEVDIISGAAYSGSYGAKVVNVAYPNRADFYLFSGIFDLNPIAVRFRFKLVSGQISTSLTAAPTIMGIAPYNFELKLLNVSGIIRFVASTGSDGINIVNSTGVSFGTWYELRARIKAGSPGFYTFYINGILSYDSGDIENPDEDNVDGLLFGENTGHVGRLAFTAYYDDIDVLIDWPTLTADLEPDDTGPDWVFTEWRYYTFTVEIPSGLYSGNLDYVYIGFTEILSSNGTFGFAAWSNSSGWDSATNLPYATRDLEPIRTKSGSWSNDTDSTVVTFPLWFTKSCLDIWLEEDAVDGLVWYNDTTGSSSGWETIEADFFRIYTDGGFSRVSSGYGDAGALPGGRDFNMYAYNNSYVFKDLYWRDLQHIKLVPEIQFRAGYQYFQLNYGFDYILKDGSYVAGLHLQFEPDAVSYTGVFASNVWINYTVSWYDNNTWVKAEDLYSFYHGEVYKAGDYGRVKFFIDFWFDSGNASSLVAGRINAYEFPMQDASAAWLRWLSSTWGVMDTVTKQSECIVPIHSSDETVINSENIEFVRVWSSLAVPEGEYNQYVAVLGFDTFDTTLSPEPTLKGIFTPPWDETKMPVVGNTGLLGAVWSMFAGIGKWLSDNILFGGLSLWPTFVAFLDTIASWLGMPNGFSNLIAWLGTGWGWLVSSFTYALTMIYDIFLMLAAVMGSLIWMLGQAIVSFASVIGMIAGFLAGTFGGAGDLWTQLGLSTWITVAIIFYPLYLIILWDQKGMDAVISQLSMIWGIMSWLAHFFISIIQTVITVLSGVVESIPVVE